MKKFVVFAEVVVAGLLAFVFVTTGELTLKPSFSKSEEERAVQDLQHDFDAMQKRFAQAYRAAAVGGIDTTSDADAAITSIKSIKRELETVRKKLSEEKAKRNADELASAILAFEKNL